MIAFTAEETERERLDAITQRDAEDGPDWRNRYLPGTFGCHEALDVSSLLMRLVATELLEHGAILQNAEWYRLANEAHTALFNLYQAIGAVHLDTDPKT